MRRLSICTPPPRWKERRQESPARLAVVVGQGAILADDPWNLQDVSIITSNLQRDTYSIVLPKPLEESALIPAFGQYRLQQLVLRDLGRGYLLGIALRG